LAELSRVPERLLESDGPQPDGAADDRHMRFWARPAAPSSVDSTEGAGGAPRMHGPIRPRHEPVHEPVHGVTLRGGAILLVPRPLSDRDRDEIAAAAAPLLDLLDSRGLLEGSSA
jgi:hypothetical protein